MKHTLIYHIYDIPYYYDDDDDDDDDDDGDDDIPLLAFATAVLFREKKTYPSSQSKHFPPVSSRS